MTTVAIAEKGSVAAVGRKARPSWTWVALQGHVREAPLPAKGSEHYFKPDGIPYVVDELPMVDVRATKPKLDAAVKAIKAARQVVMAVDYDREGCLIGKEVLDKAGYRGPVSYLDTRDATDVGLARALDKLDRGHTNEDRFWRWAFEAECRQFEDWHLGLNASQAASLFLRPHGLKGVWSTGAVQSPIVGLIVERELAIRDFKPALYYDVGVAVAAVSGHDLVLWHYRPEATRIKDIAEARAIAASAEGFSGRLAVTAEDRMASPPRFYDLSALQAKAGKLWGWKPSRTLEIAQSLYEPGGPTLLTYPRGDGRYLPDDHVQLIGARLAAISGLGGRLAELAAPLVKSKGWVVRKGSRYNSAKVLGHFAIVPTESDPAPARLSADQATLYHLIAQNFLANHLPDALDLRTTIELYVPHPKGDPKAEELRFAATGDVEKSPGWRIAFGADEDASDDDPKKQGQELSERLPPVKNGEGAVVEETEVKGRETKPPRRYTLGELPKVMGRLIDYVDDPETKAALKTDNPDQPKGLGTPATRDSHVEHVIEQGYVETLKGGGKDPQLRPTSIGLLYYFAWRAARPDMVRPVSRAETEFRLSQVGEAASLALAREAASSFRRRAHEQSMALVAAARKVGQSWLDDELRSLVPANDGLRTGSGSPRAGSGRAGKRKFWPKRGAGR